RQQTSYKREWSSDVCSSNLYELNEEIIKRASKKTYISFINENIFMPLKMNHSVFTFEELQNFEEVTELYAFTKDKARERFFSPRSEERRVGKEHMCRELIRD